MIIETKEKRELKISNPFTREELQDIIERAEGTIFINRMPAGWVAAYRNIAAAADYIDAMIARAEVK